MDLAEIAVEDQRELGIGDLDDVRRLDLRPLAGSAVKCVIIEPSP